MYYICLLLCILLKDIVIKLIMITYFLQSCCDVPTTLFSDMYKNNILGINISLNTYCIIIY